MIRTERSAGFIIFHVDPQTGNRQYLLLDYGPYWDFPKGHLEAGEDDLTAARRELQEETGLTSIRELPGFAREISYFFRANRKPVRKTVVFFLAETLTTAITLSDEHVDSRFFDFEVALPTLKYPNARELLREADRLLSGPQ